MKVIIPVAGFGTRLRPHTLTKAKVLMNVAGKPMISHIVGQIIKDKLATEIIIITGFLGEDIEKYLKNNYKFKFTFIKQEEPLGLGHAIFTAKKYLYPKLKEDLLIILGDTLFDVNLKDLCKSKHSRISVKKVDDPRRFGVVEKDSKGFVTRLVEKPSSPAISKSKEAIVGIYLIKNGKLLFDSLEYIIKNNFRTKGEFQLTDALERMLRKGEKMNTYPVKGWLDCGKPETILQTNRYLLNKSRKKYKIKTVKIINPVHIGNNVELQNCTIGPNVTIEDGCKIQNSKIKNSIIHSNCEIIDSILEESLIGDNCVIKNQKGKFNIGDFSIANK
jgi:glucose-1-phosphate thymidylyltransferase